MEGSYDTGRFADVGNLDLVSSHADVARVTRQMLDDLLAHLDEWENGTLERFLEALAASLEGLPERGEELPGTLTWKMLAEALVKASGYE